MCSMHSSYLSTYQLQTACHTVTRVYKHRQSNRDRGADRLRPLATIPHGVSYISGLPSGSLHSSSGGRRDQLWLWERGTGVKGVGVGSGQESAINAAHGRSLKSTSCRGTSTGSPRSHTAAEAHGLVWLASSEQELTTDECRTKEKPPESLGSHRYNSQTYRWKRQHKAQVVHIRTHMYVTVHHSPPH